MKKLLGLVIALCLIATTAIGYPMAYFDVGNGSVVEAASNYSKGYYKVTPSEGLNLRAEPGTSHKSVAVIKQGVRIKVTKIKKGWGHTSCDGKKGWVSLKYTSYIGKFLPGKYKVTADVGLCLRKERSTSSKKLRLIPYKKVITIKKFRGNWGRTSYKDRTGWVSMTWVRLKSATGGVSGSQTTSPSEPEKTTVTKYKVTADVGLCLRKGPGTSYKKLAVIPYKKRITLSRIKNGWGRTKYDGKTGWVTMEYLKKTVSSYKVTADVGLCLRSGPGTSYKKLAVIPYKKAITLSKIKNGWGRTKCYGKTGWVNMKYLKKISSDGDIVGSQVVIIKKKMVTVKKVYLKWKKMKKATKYAVFRSTKEDKGYECLFKTKRNHIINIGLERNHHYYYKVRAYIGKKKYGEMSEPVHIYAGAGYVGLPEAIRISDKKAKLKWEEEEFAHGYSIFRSSGKGFRRIEVIKDRSDTSYVDKGLDPDKKYVYKIRAYRKINGKYYYSEFSKENEVGIYRGPSDITISGATKPKTLKVSQTFTLKGKIHSEYDLAKVIVGICTTKGKWKKGMYVVRRPGNNTFRISSVDALIKFDQLKKGTYRYKVKAVDSRGYIRTLINCKFTVKATKFRWPCGDRSCITSYFGYRAVFGDYHPAIDIAVPKGTPIHASRSGTVIVAQNNQYASSYGKYVIIEHSGGYQTLYAHSCKLKCSVGDKVSKGEVIALVGSTGNSTGPHCHFEIRYNGVKQNPLNYLP